MATRLPSTAFEARIEAIRQRLDEDDRDPDAGLWFSATSIEYLSGFAHIQTERPVALVITPERIELTVPRLEVERVADNPRIDAVHHYFDYPGGDPVGTIAEMLADLGVETVAGDAAEPPGTMGYQGPSLEDRMEQSGVAGEDGTADFEVVDQAWVSRMRWEKSDAELALIRESARWANLAHRYLVEYTHTGAHPATVSQRASMDASRAMLDTLGDRYVPRTRGDGPVHAGYITGPQTRLPHGHTANRRLEAGDVMITGASALVDGYRSELERTMFLGEPGDEQRHYFELACEAQEIAIDCLGPGEEIDAVAEAVWGYFEEQGVTELAQHHVGHNIGMEGHEPPYLDRGWSERYEGSATELAPGQIYTIEPGLYTDKAGYRHSDTIAITESGTEWLTYYPRDLESNVIDG